jgi:hypothetical protein
MQFQEGSCDSTFVCNFHTCSGSHTASYPMDTEDFSPGENLPKREAPSNAEVRNGGFIPPPSIHLHRAALRWISTVTLLNCHFSASAVRSQQTQVAVYPWHGDANSCMSSVHRLVVSISVLSARGEGVASPVRTNLSEREFHTAWDMATGDMAGQWPTGRLADWPLLPANLSFLVCLV